MAIRDLLDEEQWRARLVLVLMLAAFGGLLGALWQKQVAQGATYQQGLERQSVRRVRLPGIRGRLYDRNGRCLADNRPCYNVALYLEELRQPGRWSNTIARVEAVLDDLSGRLGLPREVTTEDIRNHIRRRLPLPLVAWRDVGEVVLARLAEQGVGLSGVDIALESVREYPFGPAACHVLGYCGRADPPRDEQEPFHFYLPEMVGRAGIEKRYDDVLQGDPGGRLLLVDVSGYLYRNLGDQKPLAGCDVRLTLDIRLQQVLDRALEGRVGAGVILDPNNGDVLAMTSVPGFDPNRFMPMLTPAQWRAIVEDKDRPLLNRAIAASYAPGSTFKPVVALAALESGRATAQTTFYCPGYFTLGRGRWSCWYEPGHGSVNLRQAIERSCNVYFFQLGLQCGFEAIYHMAGALGVGQPTGIELDGEFTGLLPSEYWKKRYFGDSWRDGDTVNVSIGQGALLITPLQLALITGAIANGGRLYRPRLVWGTREAGADGFEERPPQIARTLNWSPVNLRLLREAMKDVVMSPSGTGRLAQIPGVVVAGKTGTAEYGRKDEGLRLGWMVAYAPADQPRYAVALVVEEAETGGRTAAPLMREILRGLFEQPTAARG